MLTYKRLYTFLVCTYMYVTLCGLLNLPIELWVLLTKINEQVDFKFHFRIACISCPTLFTKLLEIKPSDVEVMLLEYDRRFEVYGDSFCYYDYNDPLNLSEKLVEHSFGLVMADPPFLSEECLRKMAETVKYLASDKIIICTGKENKNVDKWKLNLRTSLKLGNVIE